MRRSALLFLCIVWPCVTRAQDSRSVGAPDRGRLEEAVALPDSDHYVRLASRGVQWGTEELTGLLRRSAERLQREEEGPRLLVGSLSTRGGGRLRPHESHQSGRDADVSIFVTDDQGEPVAATRFVELSRRTGCGRNEGRTVCIDPRRTFLFLLALVQDRVPVRFVLIAGDLRQLVLAAGRRTEASEDEMNQVERITALRRGSASHRSHLHIRIECPEADTGCAR